MKTEVIRRMDELGRIVIPADMKKQLGLTEKSLVGIELRDDQIILTKSKPYCVVCHSSENELTAIERCLICSECIDKIKSM